MLVGTGGTMDTIISSVTNLLEKAGQKEESAVAKVVMLYTLF